MNVILYLLFSKIKLFIRKYGLCGRKIYDILAEYFLTLQYGIRTL